MSQKYLLDCECGRKLVVETSQAGESIVCPCGARLEVPSMQAIRRLEPVRSDSSRGRTAEWGWRQATILLGTLIAVVSVASALYLHAMRPRLGDPYALSPFQTWAVWQQLRMGLDRHPTPWDKQFLDAVRDNRRWRVVWLGIAACGTLVAAVSALRKDRRPGRKTSRRRLPPMAAPTQSLREAPQTPTLHGNATDFPCKTQDQIESHGRTA